LLNQRDVGLNFCVYALDLSHCKLLKLEPSLTRLVGKLRISKNDLALAVGEVADARQNSVFV
jgi:hypothetical protein